MKDKFVGHVSGIWQQEIYSDLWQKNLFGGNSLKEQAAGVDLIVTTCDLNVITYKLHMQ
jgi:hypothetical protein